MQDQSSNGLSDVGMVKEVGKELGKVKMIKTGGMEEVKRND